MKQELRIIGFATLLFGWLHGFNSSADDASVAKRDSAWVDERVEAWQPTKAERAFDDIAWARDIGEAARLAKEHGRPIFLFTYDGADLACYRC